VRQTQSGEPLTRVNAGVVATAGGYAYLPGDGTRPFSAGVVALPGYALRRVRLRRPLPFGPDGLLLIDRVLRDAGLPHAALAACELRSPAPMTFAEFKAFNSEYIWRLNGNGFGLGDAHPIARSNLAPQHDPPAGNTLFAFTYAAPAGAASGGGPDYVISGKPENTAEPPGVIAPGDVSPAGMRRKAEHVIGALRERVAALGANWDEITGVQIYTVHSLDPLIDLLASNGLLHAGVTLFPSYPPLVDFDFEIDVRAVSAEYGVA